MAFRGGSKNLCDPSLLRGRKTENDFRCVRVSADDWEFGGPMQGVPFRVDGKGRVLVSF